MVARNRSVIVIDRARVEAGTCSGRGAPDSTAAEVTSTTTVFAAMRVCTLNVHLWSDRRGRSNTDRVIEFLRALECDVVALQEVLRDGSQLERVALALGMHRAFGAESWLGNALLSAAPLDAIDPAPITAGLEGIRGPTRHLDGTRSLGLTDNRYMRSSLATARPTDASRRAHWLAARTIERIKVANRRSVAAS